MKRIICIAVIAMFVGTLMCGCMEKEEASSVEVSAMFEKLDDEVEKVKIQNKQLLLSLDYAQGDSLEGEINADGLWYGHEHEVLGSSDVIAVRGAEQDVTDVFLSLKSMFLMAGFDPIERMDYGDVCIHYQRGDEEIYLVLQSDSVIIVQM